MSVIHRFQRLSPWSWGLHGKSLIKSNPKKLFEGGRESLFSRCPQENFQSRKLMKRSFKDEGMVEGVDGVSVQGSAQSSSPKKAKQDQKDITSMLLFTHDKAGMKGVDKDYVNQVIYESSKDSEYYKRQLRDDDRNQVKWAALRKEVGGLCASSAIR